MPSLFNADPRGQLNPEDYNYFLTKRRQINDTLGLGTAQTQYQRNTSRLGHNQRRQQLVQQFSRVGERLPGRFARRGLLNSGLYHKGVAEHLRDRDASLANLDQDFNQQLYGLDLADTQLEAVRRSALDDIEAQEAARRAAIAAMIRPHL